MEDLATFVCFVTLLVLIAKLVNRGADKSLSSRAVSKQSAREKHAICEQEVSFALRNMNVQSYVVFDNLVLPSSGNTPHTEIDHVVVSPFGIFCIETKSHRGSIYGYKDSKKWKQYLGGKEFDFYNPYRQNYKHTEALRRLLGSNLHMPIHSYVVFPNATTVKIDNEYVDASIKEVIRRIEKHKTRVYNLHDCERILKTLAYASSKRDALIKVHASEVAEYIRSREALVYAE